MIFSDLKIFFWLARLFCISYTPHFSSLCWFLVPLCMEVGWPVLPHRRAKLDNNQSLNFNGFQFTLTLTGTLSNTDICNSVFIYLFLLRHGSNLVIHKHWSLILSSNFSMPNKPSCSGTDGRLAFFLCCIYRSTLPIFSQRSLEVLAATLTYGPFSCWT